jgi:hypothetical protein
MDRSRWYSMKRQINPSAVLNFDEMENIQPLPEPEIERIRAEFENTFMGPESSGQLFVSTPGAKLEPWGMTPKEMEYHQSWSQLVDFCMAGFGIGKQAAGMIEDANYATLFATLKQFHLLTLEPKCRRIAAQLTKHLAPFFGPDLLIEIKCKRIDDHEILHERVRILGENRGMTVNEMRKSLGWPVTHEEWGEERVGEQEQMDMPFMEGSGGGDKLGGGMSKSPIKEHSEEGKGKPPEVERHRPKTGDLGKGSLGPRKGLDRWAQKSFYERVRESLGNGNGKH